MYYRFAPIGIAPRCALWLCLSLSHTRARGVKRSKADSQAAARAEQKYSVGVGPLP